MTEINSIENISKLPVFFIIGRPRSGTTLLRTLLDAHPNVMIPLESPIFIVLYNKYHGITKWDNATIDMLCDDLKKVPKFGSWTIDIGNIRKSLKNSNGMLTYAEICKIIYANYQSFFKKGEIKIIGDKNPPYIDYIKKLNKIFPEAKFVYLQRDYRDQIISMRKLRTENPGISIQLFRWKQAYKNFLNFKNKFPARCLEIKYEDLTRQPEKILTEVCSFFNLEYYGEMLEFYKIKDEVYSKYPKDVIDRAFKSLFSPINTEHVSTWKKQLNEKEERIADVMAGRYAKIAGYERRFETRSLFIYLMEIPNILYCFVVPVVYKFLNALPFRWNIKFRKKIAKVMGRNFYRLKLYNDY